MRGEKYGRVMVENPSSELKRDVVKLNNVCNIYTLARALYVHGDVYSPCSPPSSARRANVTPCYTSASSRVEYLCDNPHVTVPIHLGMYITEIVINWHQFRSNATDLILQPCWSNLLELPLYFNSKKCSVIDINKHLLMWLDSFSRIDILEREVIREIILNINKDKNINLSVIRIFSSSFFA